VTVTVYFARTLQFLDSDADGFVDGAEFCAGINSLVMREETE
jgi:hypothetical protein